MASLTALLSAHGLLVDSLIIVGYFVAIVTIGLRLGRRDGSLHEFALGGRRVPWWAVMASIVAAETSAATFLGTPGEGYTNLSFWYVQLVFGLILGRIIVGKCFLGPYYKYNVYTVYDYLDVRFGPVSKSYVSILFLLMRTLASGTRLFVPSLVIVLAWRMFVGGETVAFSQASVTSVIPYACAITGLMIITCLYTAVGGIKAVIWTDVFQAGLMFGAAVIAVGTLLYHIGGDSMNPMDGLNALHAAVPKLSTHEGYFLTGFESSVTSKWMAEHHLARMNVLEYVKLILASQYTLFSALIASTVSSVAQFGTDQDMVQRMLTAETAKKASRSLITSAFADIPIAGAFCFVGILLFVYFQQHPTAKPLASNEVFGSYILHNLPVVIRGLVLAGVFATAMGSLSAALNALATSATNDWYLKFIGRGTDRRARGSDPEPAMSSITGHNSARARIHDAGIAQLESDRQSVLAARVFTLVFAVLLILVAVGFALATIRDPSVRIIPVVLGIANFIIGPMLGVFLIGIFTRNRGSDLGNVIAISAGLLATIIFGGLHADAGRFVADLIGSSKMHQWADASGAWLPKVAFTWFGVVGAVAVVAVGIWFRTPEHALARASRVEADAKAGDSRPMELRDH